MSPVRPCPFPCPQELPDPRTLPGWFELGTITIPVRSEPAAQSGKVQNTISPSMRFPLSRETSLCPFSSSRT